MPCLLFTACEHQHVIVVRITTFRVWADKRKTHIETASLFRNGCHYRAFGFRARWAARVIRRTLARFSGRCVQCNRLRGRSLDRRVSSLRASRTPMALSIACLSVRSSAMMFDSFNVSPSWEVSRGDSGRLVPYHRLTDKLFIAHHNFHRVQ